MEETRREFVKTINLQFIDYCKSKDKEPTPEEFATYLVNRTLISDLTVKRFLVVDKYPHVLSANMGVKQVAIWQLEEEVKCSFSTIKTYLDRFQTFFRVKDRVNSKSEPL